MILKGMVQNTIFKNEQSGFAIHRIALFDDQVDMVIKGTLAHLEIDASYQFEGTYVDDPKYGIQFLVSSAQPILPEGRDFTIQYLTGPSFKGIGVKSAERIVDTYGDDVLDQIRSGALTQLSVRGVSQERLDELVETLVTQTPIDEAINMLINARFSQTQVNAIIDAYGEATLMHLEANPYRIVREISGVGFKSADVLGKMYQFENDHPYRKEAFILDRLKQDMFGSGHSYLPMANVLQQYESYIPQIESLIELREFVIDDERLYHSTQYDAETFIAKTLKSRMNSKHSDTFDSVLLDAIQDDLGLSFDAVQQDAIAMFMEHDVSVLTGGPGTGKSTLLSGIVQLIRNTFPEYHIVLCAPTGRAAKRLEDVTHVEASTIHSILRYDMESFTFGYNEANPLEADVVIVDEFSMVDTWLFYNLLKASKHVKKFLFVGDKDQIPSVGPGSVLFDLLDSNVLPVTFLEYNYRQAQGSEVIDCALSMNQGSVDLALYHRDVRFFEGNVLNTVVQCVKQALDKGYSIHDIQVLAPMYSVAGGIDILNHHLQELCNPASKIKKETHFGKRIFREGDKVLQLKNQPDDFVFNGDIGTLISIQKDEWIVDFEGNEVSYDASMFINLTHAYAMSIHKAQGSEYPIVILVALVSFGRMLTRKLYYTGVTRASKSLILVGEAKAFQLAVENHADYHRYTGLSKRLQ